MQLIGRRRIRELTATALTACTIIAISANAKSDPPVTEVATGLGVVTSINFMNRDDLIVTKRYGVIHRFSASARAPQRGELLNDFGKTAGFNFEWADGLMNAVIDPLTSDIYVYASFKGLPQKVYRVYRLKYFTTPAKRFDDAVLVVDGLPYGRSHSGGAIAIVGSYLYVTTSDGEESGYKNAQDVDQPHGKLLRIPLRELRAAKRALEFNRNWVFACGLRDSQGIAVTRHHNKMVLVSTDHGPTFAYEKAERERDELNFLPLRPHSKPLNFGWPRLAANFKTGHFDSVKNNGCADDLSPERIWGPDGKKDGIAPSGVAVLKKKDHPWDGDIFVAALKGGSIRHLYTNARGSILGEEARFSDGIRKRAIACNNEGICYYSTSKGDQTTCSPPNNCKVDGIRSFALGR